MHIRNIFKSGHNPDYVILVSTAFLVVLGIIMISSASSHLGINEFGDGYFYLKRHLLYGVLVGIIGFLIASKVNYRVYEHKAFSVTFLILSILALALVFTPLGVTIKGATRWLSLGPLTFQPAELLKLSLVIYLASWLSQRGYRQKKFKQGFLPFIIIIGIISGVLILQRSTSPVAILLAVSLIMYFMSGAKLRYIGGVVALGLISLAAVIAITPYRAERVLTFLNPEADPSGSGFHILQAKTAIGAGGLLGVGYGQSTVKYRLPEPIGDSIFAIIGEEFGFLGTIAVIGFFAFLVTRIFLLYKQVYDNFGKALLIGFGSIIGIQAIVNIGAMSGVLPLTGTPLPFVSYGGTALAVFLTMIGIITNISKFASRA